MGQRLRAAAEILNPSLDRFGFMGAQYGGSPSEPVSALYCAGFEDFTTRFPHLVRALQLRSGETSCVDLIIEVDNDDLVRGLSLELPLERACQLLGRYADAAVVASMIGTDVLDSVDTLQPVLGALFSQAEPA